jgi:hypothetical protein
VPELDAQARLTKAGEELGFAGGSGDGLADGFGRGVTSAGSGTRISWESTVHRDSLMPRMRSIPAPPRPASTTPTASTRCCSSGVRR